MARPDESPQPLFHEQALFLAAFFSFIKAYRELVSSIRSLKFHISLKSWERGCSIHVASIIWADDGSSEVRKANNEITLVERRSYKPGLRWYYILDTIELEDNHKWFHIIFAIWSGPKFYSRIDWICSCRVSWGPCYKLASRSAI